MMELAMTILVWLTIPMMLASIVVAFMLGLLIFNDVRKDMKK